MTDDAGARSRRAVVLGGGGVAGIAWESALIVTLREHGIDLAAAEVVVGTSAGSVVGTALRAGGLEQWISAKLEPAASGAAADLAASDLAEYDAVTDIDVEPVTAAFTAAAESTAGERETREELGRFALTAPLARTERASLARIGALLPSGDWPAGELRITVVDAEDGTFRVIDSADGVELVAAVAASCAVPGVYPTIEIGGRQYMDGGMRSATNADVAADCDRILVLSCGPEADVSPLGPSLPRVVAELRDSREVLVVEADAAALAAFGANTLAPTVGPAAAEEGVRQAASVVDSVRAFWA